jgi:predicted adenylyl cyclase CyaB
MLEIEVKIRIKDKSLILSKISGMAGEANLKCRFEDDTLFDFDDLRLFDSGAMFRLRISSEAEIDNAERFIIKDNNPGYTLTWKGILNIDSSFKEREELEFDVEDSSAVFPMLKSFGLKPVFRYQKYRFSADLADGKIFLDETPMGYFLEIEGKPDWIDRASSLLGFKSSEYINLDYYMLWRQYCAENRLPGGDMLFKDKRVTK